MLVLFDINLHTYPAARVVEHDSIHATTPMLGQGSVFAALPLVRTPDHDFGPGVCEETAKYPTYKYRPWRHISTLCVVT